MVFIAPLMQYARRNTAQLLFMLACARGVDDPALGMHYIRRLFHACGTAVVLWAHVDASLLALHAKKRACGALVAPF